MNRPVPPEYGLIPTPALKKTLRGPGTDGVTAINQDSELWSLVSPGLHSISITF